MTTNLYPLQTAQRPRLTVDMKFEGRFEFKSLDEFTFVIRVHESEDEKFSIFTMYDNWGNFLGFTTLSDIAFGYINNSSVYTNVEIRRATHGAE